MSFLSASDSSESDSASLSVSVEEPSATSATSVTSSLDISVDAMDVSLDVSAIDSGNEGPTALVVGGVHGDENAGYLAAEEMLDWEPNAGRLVVLPKANPVAIENSSRTTDYGDLNRNFDIDDPTTPLAESIWSVVEETDPDVVLSLHEARGVYDSSSSVGQAVFRSPTSEALEAARMGINQANKTIRRRSLMFDIGHISPPSNSPSGLLTEKTTYGLGVPSFIVETYEDVSLDSRIKWQKKITQGVLDYFDLY
jgi:predicted deacylase